MTNEEQIIQTAHARVEGAPLTVPVDFGERLGGVQRFTFLRAFGMPVAEALVQVEEAKGFAAQMSAYREFLLRLAVPDDREALAARIDSGELDFSAIEALSHRLLQELTGRVPTRPGSSSDGSGSDGQPSTGGALPEPSTPLPYLPTDS